VCGAMAASMQDATKASRRSQQIETVVVIYAENRSFDNLYGFFPGANGLLHVPAACRCNAIAMAPSSRNCRRFGAGSPPRE